MSTPDSDTPPQERGTDFEAAGEEAPLSLLAEFFLFLKEEKRWWLTPILVVLLLIGLVAGLVATGAAPFIYSLF